MEWSSVLWCVVLALSVANMGLYFINRRIRKQNDEIQASIERSRLVRKIQAGAK